MDNQTNASKVRSFMKIFGQEVKQYPEFPENKTLDLRLNLIKEEVAELIEGVELRDIENVAKELTDVLYVTYGMGASLGIDLDACFTEVHRSNLSKLENGKVIYREDGKVMKGKDYSSANIREVLTLAAVGHP